MRITVLADTHLPLFAPVLPPEVLASMRDSDLVIHAGDIDTLQGYEHVRQSCQNLVAVRGNRDSFKLNRRSDGGGGISGSEDFPEILPETEIVEAGLFRIGVIHGWGPRNSLPQRIRSRWKNPVDLLVFGHSHVPFNGEVGGLRMLNPGSPTDGVIAPHRGYAVIDVSDALQVQLHTLLD